MNVTRIAYDLKIGQYEAAFTRKMFFAVSTVYFFSGLFFRFSLIKLISVNLVMLSTIAVSYVFNKREIFEPDILYLLAIIFFNEISAYYLDKSNRALFIEKIQNEMILNYFFEILIQMKAGFVIIQDKKIIFQNNQFENFLNLMITDEERKDQKINEDNILEWVSQNIELNKNKIKYEGNNLIESSITHSNEQDTVINLNYSQIDNNLNFNKLGVIKSLTK